MMRLTWRSILVCCFLSFFFSADFCIAGESHEYANSGALVGELIEAVAKAELELLSCKLLSREAGLEPRVELSVAASNVADVLGLINNFRQKHPLIISSFSIKPFALFHLTLTFTQQHAEDDLTGHITPLGKLPLFEPKTVAEGVSLFGCNIQGSGSGVLQVVAPNILQLSDFIKSNVDQTYSRASTLSRTLIGSAQTFTLDLQSDTRFIPALQLLADFDRVSKIVDLWEISSQVSNSGKFIQKILFHAPADKLENIAIDILKDASLSLSALEVTPIGQPDWAFVLTLEKRDAVMPPERVGALFKDVAAVLRAPWPPSKRDTLHFLWTPDSLEMTTVIKTEADIEILKPIAASLGLLYNGLAYGVPMSKPDNFEPGAVSVSFKRGMAQGKDSSDAVKQAASRLFLETADILEDQIVAGNRHLLLACPFDSMLKLIERISIEYGNRVVSLAMECKYGEPCKTTLSLASEDMPESKGILDTARLLISAGLPWNLPDSALENDVVITGFNIENSSRFSLFGSTMKSHKIFTRLFPALTALRGVKEPFFKYGSYKDYKNGRLMNFEVTADITRP